MFKRKLKTLLLKLVEVRLKSIKCSSEVAEIHYLMTFPNNDQGLIQSLINEFGCSSVKIGYQKICEKEAEKWREQGVKIYPLDYSPTFFIKSLKEVLHAKVLIVDNYIAFLGKFRLYSEAVIFQIWHANGAIKTFGWEDYQTQLRGQEEQERFQAVYDAVDYYVVGSDSMADVFIRSYHISEEKVLRTGLPRTDYFFDESISEHQRQRFASLFPEAAERTVVLYSPTYRNSDSHISEEWLLDDQYLLFEKKHPHQETLILTNPSVIRDFKGMSLPDLLFSVDVLVTDYSSIPFEYVLARPQGYTYLYWYDKDGYRKQIGLQPCSEKEYEQMVVTSKQELIKRIVSKEQVNHESLMAWNTYNDGRATHRFIKKVKEIIDKGE